MDGSPVTGTRHRHEHCVELQRRVTRHSTGWRWIITRSRPGLSCPRSSQRGGRTA
jgi:hypothetical protein